LRTVKYMGLFSGSFLLIELRFSPRWLKSNVTQKDTGIGLLRQSCRWFFVNCSPRISSLWVCTLGSIEWNMKIVKVWPYFWSEWWGTSTT
jgi:hypothetical protein